jgi:hypothetical protein
MLVDALVTRVGIKAITDFTGVVQFRGPGEMGGAPWMFSQGMALVASLVTTHIYLSDDDAAEDGNVMSTSLVWALVGALSCSEIFVFSCFLLLMKRDYRGTFFSLQTGHAWVKSLFLDNEEDHIKMFLHGQNRKQWASIRGDVKAYTLENWERWEEEKPAFFTAAFKASVDDDMIPPASLRGLGGPSRRRSSLGDALGGGGAGGGGEGGARGSAAVAPVA